MVRFTEDMKSAGFEVMPEGPCVLRVKKVTPVKQNGKLRELKFTFEDSKGRLVFNNYNMNPNASYYANAMKALYSLLKTGCALEEDEDGSIDEMKAVGRYFRTTIKHTKSNDGTRTFANLGYIEGHATGFDDEADDVVSDEDDFDDDPYA